MKKKYVIEKASSNGFVHDSNRFYDKKEDEVFVLFEETDSPTFLMELFEKYKEIGIVVTMDYLGLRAREYYKEHDNADMPEGWKAGDEYIRVQVYDECIE